MKSFSLFLLGALMLGASAAPASAIQLFDGVPVPSTTAAVEVDLGNEAAAARVDARANARDTSAAAEAKEAINLRDRIRARMGLEATVETKTMPPQDDRGERRDYLKAKIRHEESIETYRDAREAFLEVKARFRASKSAEEKQALEDRAEAFLRQTVETMIERLNRVKSWAANHPRVSDAVEASVTAKIDAEIAVLKNAVATLPENATLEQIQSVAAAVRARFSVYQETIREVVADIRISRIRAALDTAETLTARLETAIADAEESGIDVTAAEGLFAEAKVNLALAGQKYATADFKAAQTMILDVLKDMRQVMVHLKAGATLQ